MRWRDRRRSRKHGHPDLEGFHCTGCGQQHDSVPLAFHSSAPAPWTDELHGREGNELTSDACVIDDEHFFIRGLIRIPHHR